MLAVVLGFFHGFILDLAVEISTAGLLLVVSLWGSVFMFTVGGERVVTGLKVTTLRDIRLF